MEEKYIAALDIGTTTVRCYIFNSKTETVGKACDEVVLHYPQTGYVEIDPEELWQSIIGVVNNALKDAKLTAEQLTCLGLSTQRSTFITWSRSTGLPFHRFITWKDLRADRLVRQWNDSITWKAIKAGSYALFLLLRSKRFRAGSVLKFMNTQTTLRLSWALQNVEPLKKAVTAGDAMFGTLDTWLLYKLTEGELHVTDASSASATGFYDPFTMQWAGWALALFSIPAAVLPRVVDTSGRLACTRVWNAPVPIVCSMADQTAAMWGSCCFEAGDAKLTMGTGTFLDVNTGTEAHAGVAGLYPVVAWRAGSELVYMAEGANNDTGSIVTWAQNAGLFDDPADTARIASSVPDSDGVYFVPAFSGLGPPYNESCAGSGLIGVQASTRREHLVRAILEAVAFRTARLHASLAAETAYRCDTIRLDGGVANNDFVAQLISDLTGARLERPAHTDMSALGCAHMAGLHLGIWSSKEEIKALRKVGRVFTPRPHVKRAYEPIIARWEKALKCFSHWYDNDAPAPTDSVSDLNALSPQSSLKVKEAYKKRSSK